MIAVFLRRPGRQRATIDLDAGSTIDDFKDSLDGNIDFDGLAESSFNVNEEAKDSSYVLQNDDVLTVRTKVVGG